MVAPFCRTALTSRRFRSSSARVELRNAADAAQDKTRQDKTHQEQIVTSARLCRMCSLACPEPGLTNQSSFVSSIDRKRRFSSLGMRATTKTKVLSCIQKTRQDKVRRQTGRVRRLVVAALTHARRHHTPTSLGRSSSSSSSSSRVAHLQPFRGAPADTHHSFGGVCPTFVPRHVPPKR